MAKFEPEAPKSFWRWGPKQVRAAELIAANELTQAEVCAEVGIAKRTLERWLNRPEFRARVNEILAAEQERVIRRGVLLKQNRLDRLNETWQGLRQVIKERSEHPDYQDVPGGKTGLLAYTVKTAGMGKYGPRIIREYAVDVALLRELRAIEEQAARELGEWTDQAELSVRGVINLGDDALTEDQRQAIRRALTTPADA